MMKIAAAATMVTAAMAAPHNNKFSEVWSLEEEVKQGIDRKGSWTTPRPQDYVRTEDLPAAFTWGDKDGVNMLTKSLNQHIPQYCGSCWAHGAISALGDRIKIARSAKGIDINLAVQHVLNCGTAGSCHGGSAAGVYQWLAEISEKGSGVAYDTCNPYLACSKESKEGLCPSGDFTCTPENVCRTCSTFSDMGGHCSGLDHYPNATVAEHGDIQGADAMAKEIFARGPIACGIYAAPILNYTGGIASMKGEGVDHIISVVGWGSSSEGTQYWIVRNSWGEFWGDMGYVYVEKGKNALLLESMCSWATPKAWTEKNFACDEGGENCPPTTGFYADPGLAHVSK